MATCYRHPSRETGVSCSSCGRPICPDCMTTTPVGMRCPECARQRTPVHTLRTMQTVPRVTYALIAINVILFLASDQFGLNGGTGDALYRKLALYGPAIRDNNEYWRIVSGGFLHEGLLHIFFNMFLLYLLGQLLEPALGSVRFAAIYFTSLLTASFGALLVTPNALTVGASGAVFGLMGAAAVEYYARGINPLQTQIGFLILINLLLSFTLSGLSIGGHIGGLVGGILAALAIQAGDRRRSQALGLLGCLVIAVGSAAGALAAAESSSPVNVLSQPAAPVGIGP
jgi:membrane associated rhomboid family serine protease